MPWILEHAPTVGAALAAALLLRTLARRAAARRVGLADTRSLAEAPPRAAASVAVAGLAGTVACSVVLFAVAFAVGGTAEPTLTVLVERDSAAERAGMRDGDVLERIAARAVSSWTDVRGAVSASRGRSVPVVVRRDGATVELHAEPEPLGGGRYRLGVVSVPRRMPASAGAVIAASLAAPVSALASVGSDASSVWFGAAPQTALGRAELATVQSLPSSARSAYRAGTIASWLLGLLLLPFPGAEGSLLVLLAWESLARARAGRAARAWASGPRALLQARSVLRRGAPPRGRL